MSTLKPNYIVKAHFSHMKESTGNNAGEYEVQVAKDAHVLELLFGSEPAEYCSTASHSSLDQQMHPYVSCCTSASVQKCPDS